MSGQTATIFVYGTLKHGERFHCLLGEDVKLLGGATVNAQMYSLPEGYPALVPGEGIARGEVYSMSTDKLRTLDELEGYVPDEPANLYRRTEENVRADNGRLLSCLVYWFNDEEYARRYGELLEDGCWTEKG